MSMCERCGLPIQELGVSAVGERCRCIPYFSAIRGYYIVEIRPEQYQELIDRLERIERLLIKEEHPDD